ncbi:hypothetical protein A33Q_3826 [Indibacter alkaliphilus LW1]|jgi:hypothetical protein|uniref:Uncharacterized protein n=1 Tax=Indibacter alkaliphilus (strain CCUG 57479 / KCTC 22604 / LW1) TaxID=1189612 RepID=S2DMS4_INDAL|nr:hypothetical protein [Indibacter alkaliphilus]EOZ93236.1 hypothetical protein A33Q_3826 [Indibacter alkaliphilus LW1]
MKKFLIMVFVVWAGIAYGQTTEKETANKVEQNKTPEKVNQDPQAGRERGLSISGAARKSTLNRERGNNANSSRGNSDFGKERSAERANNGNNPGRATGRPEGVGKPQGPPQARPNVNVPQSRPNAPVVRPNRPTPQRPNNPPGRPNNPPGRPGGG